MSETLLERHYRDRVESVRQMTLLAPDNGTRSWHDYDDLVALCVELAGAGVVLIEQEYKRAFHQERPTVNWLRERRDAIEALCDAFLALAAAVKTAVPHVAEAARPDRQTQLDSAVRAVGTARDDVLRRWPIGSDADIAAAQSATAQRDALDIDEAFAHIAGVEVGAWRRRIEAFKQQAQS